MFPTHSSNKGKKKNTQFLPFGFKNFSTPPPKKIKLKKEKDDLFRIKFNVS